MTTTQTIEIGDTVRLAGRKGKGEVTSLRPGGVEVCYTFNVRRYGQGRGCSMSFRWYDADRVVLVRKGNATDDQVKALFAEMDAARAAEAAATDARERAEAGDTTGREVGSADLARWRVLEENHRHHHRGDVLETLLCGAGADTFECGFAA